MANILVVDDSMLMRKNLKTILLTAGYNVVAEASNGLQAFTEYEKYKPDLVTMDVTMPVMDGIEALKKIRASYPEAKIVMITSLDQKDLAFEALENGASHYIIKPITSDKVLSVLDEVRRNESNQEKEDINTRWQDIKQSRDEIIELNISLEQRVEDRTSEINEANRKLKETLSTLKETQDQLIRYEKSAALSGMVAGVAHEINTPVGISLTAISFLKEKQDNLINLYKQNLMKKSDFEKYMEISKESVDQIFLNLQRASNLIKSFKQVAVDQSTDDKRSFNLKEYIDDIILSLRPELKKTSHKIVVSCMQDIFIESYPGALSQILTNLVMNSLIHGFEGLENGTITINVARGEKEINIEYSDDGVGIPEDNIKKIFNPFFTTKRGKGGNGLGLNIVYNIINDKLGGTIKCESEAGKGTAFNISFPI